jgi:hypothetical protein
MYTCAVSGLPIKPFEDIYIFPLLPYMFMNRFVNARAATQAKQMVKMGYKVDEITLENAQMYKVLDDRMFLEYSSGKPLIQPTKQLHASNLYSLAFLPLEARLLDESDEDDEKFRLGWEGDSVTSFYEYCMGAAGHIHSMLDYENNSDYTFVTDFVHQLSFAYVKKAVFDKLVKKPFFIHELFDLGQHPHYTYWKDKFEIKKKLKRIIKTEDAEKKPLKQRYYMQLFTDPDLQFLTTLVSGISQENTKYRRRFVKTLRSPNAQNMAQKTFKFLKVLEATNTKLMPSTGYTDSLSIVQNIQFSKVMLSVGNKELETQD